VVEKWSVQERVRKFYDHSFDEVPELPQVESKPCKENGDGATLNGIKLTALNELQFLSGLIHFMQDREHYSSILARLTEANEADAALITGAVRMAAYTGNLDFEVLWGAMTSEEWRTGMFLHLDEKPLQLFFDALAEAQYSADDDKRCELPHFFVDILEKGKGDPDRDELLFALTLLMSVYTDTCSALKRLLGNKDQPGFYEYAKRWHEHTKELVKGAPPWLAARTRPILAMLP
jgi:hypothetical protein